MTDLEKAARMALKTLEYIDLQDNDRGFLSYKECHDLDEAITALRQAINNNAEQPAQQEHKLWAGLTDVEIARVVSLAGFAPDWAEANIATQIVHFCQDMLKEKNIK